MTDYFQPAKELTPEERLLAAVIGLSDKIPCGGQICLALNLQDAIERVESFFTEHDLPNKEDLLGELRLWKEHAEEGRKFSDEADRLMQEVVLLLGLGAKAGQGR